MRFERKSKVGQSIPTSSMADIAFLLLVFFMVSTVFVRYRGLQVLLPDAEKTQKIETKRNITHIWASPAGEVMIDDMLVKDMPTLMRVVANKMQENPRIIVSIKADKRAPYGAISDVMEELRRAGALRINFATKRER
ncbi:MAG: biopolymer transporter ExbD [Candidatus Latescibacteria bacterium]|nr:biopolymer transporter ExbD [Candidatus Latescibacterota bacterium]MCK5734699.1 biopolymer transporter ExbD [Candidatus Latescibacterota bacterium]